MHSAKRLTSVALLGLLALSAPLARAVNYTWSNAAGGDWNDAANWTSTGGTYPGINDIGIFSTALSGPVTNAAPASTKYIQVAGTGGSAITIGATNGPAFTMGISGNATVKGSANSLGLILNAPLVLTPGSTTTSGQFKFDSQTTATTTTLVANGSITSSTTSDAMKIILTGANTGSNALTGEISDGGAALGVNVQKTAAGKWILSNDTNSFSGGVSIDQGSLSVTSLGMTGSNSAIGTNGTIKVGAAGGTTLLYTGTGDTSDKNIQLQGTSGLSIYSSGAGAIVTSGNITTTGAGGAANTLNIRGNGGSVASPNIISGVISDGSAALAVAKGDSNAWALNGANTYTGLTQINAGTLEINTVADGGSASSLGASSNAAANLVFNGGTLQYNGSSASTDRNFTINTGKTATIEVTSNTLTISGASTNTNGALTKTGEGTLILSGNNLYTGLTTISAGTLINNGMITGAVSVDTGTLGGSGTFAGAVTIAATGILAPGNSPGLLTFNGDLNLGGTTLLQIDGGARGSTYDAVNVGGTLTYGGALTIDFGSALTSDGTYALFSALDGSTAPASGGTFLSVSFGGSYDIGLTPNGTIWSTLAGGYDFSFDEATGVLSATAVAVPEPSTYAAAIGLLALAGAAYRRRRC